MGGCIRAGGGFGIALNAFEEGVDFTVLGRGDGFVTVLGVDFVMVCGRGDGFNTALGDERIIAFGRDNGFIPALEEAITQGWETDGFTTGCVMDGLFLDCTRLPSGIDCASPLNGVAFPLLISTVDFSCRYGT